MSADERGRVPIGRLALGGLLLVLGIGWLLHTLDVVEVRWQILLAASLIVVGAAIVVIGRHGGLVTLGVILTVLLAFASVLDVPFEGGVGERSHRPAAVAELEDRYRLGMGSLTVDLGDVELPSGTTVVEASVGMGELVVIVPEGIRVEVSGRAGIGEVVLFGRSQGGLGVRQSAIDGTGPGLGLSASVGIGKVEVRR
jgi:hypothetical protein